MPREKWICPWHHCVACGKPAVAWCMHCPNAYCKTHNDVLRSHPQLGVVCDEHDDDLEDTLAFYKEVVGGIANLLPNPNVPLEQQREFKFHCLMFSILLVGSVKEIQAVFLCCWFKYLFYIFSEL